MKATRRRTPNNINKITASVMVDLAERKTAATLPSPKKSPRTRRRETKDAGETAPSTRRANTAAKPAKP